MKCWRVLIGYLGVIPMIPLCVDEHPAHRLLWFPLAVWGFLWGMTWAQDDGAKRQDQREGMRTPAEEEKPCTDL